MLISLSSCLSPVSTLDIMWLRDSLWLRKHAGILEFTVLKTSTIGESGMFSYPWLDNIFMDADMGHCLGLSRRIWQCRELRGQNINMQNNKNSKNVFINKLTSFSLARNVLNVNTIGNQILQIVQYLFTYIKMQAPLKVNTWQESMGQKVKFNSGPSVIPQLAMSTLHTMWIWI